MTQEEIKKLAEEYASGMMGESKQYFTHYADITLFNTIERAYLAGYNAANQWTTIVDGDESTLPKERKAYHIWNIDVGLGIAWYDMELKCFGIKKQPTYWRPLPEPPTK